MRMFYCVELWNSVWFEKKRAGSSSVRGRISMREKDENHISFWDYIYLKDYDMYIHWAYIG
jgi:hypothetical protein